jgi:hypothetical protein
MKVIFLDNDGVICLSHNWGGRNKKWSKYRSLNPNSSNDKNEAPVDVRFDDFDKKAVKVLNEILEKTGAEIIVSSDWRYHATIDELGDYYTSQGIIKKPIAITSRTQDIDPEEWNKRFRFYAKLEEERAFEITHFLGLQPSITHWVAVDDLNMGRFVRHDGYTIEYDWGLSNFVHTPKSNEGIKQSGVKEKILNFLGYEK